MSFVEYRLVESVWVEHEVHDGKSRRAVMKKLNKGDTTQENGEKVNVQRKVRKS